MFMIHPRHSADIASIMPSINKNTLSSKKTIEQFKVELQAEGKTAVQWAEEHDFPLWAVYRVMSGMNKCHRGRAHRIAVAMGIKKDPNANKTETQAA